MKQIIRLFIISLAFLSISLQAGTTLPKLAKKHKGKSLAIVSISANNYNDSLQGWNDSNTDELMRNQLNDMLNYSEALLAKDWKVINAKTFIGKAEFQKLAGEQREVGLPNIDGKALPLFSKNRKELVKARITKDKAKQLIEVTGADFIMVIYSEWAVKTGSFVPTSKALSKNVVSVINSDGKQVYNKRSDKVGDIALGALGNVVVDKDTIGQWVVSYKLAIDALAIGKK